MRRLRVVVLLVLVACGLAPPAYAGGRAVTLLASGLGRPLRRRLRR